MTEKTFKASNGYEVGELGRARWRDWLGAAGYTLFFSALFVLGGVFGA